MTKKVKIVEPVIMLQDPDPTLDERLAADEPPVSDEDTNPSQAARPADLDARLAADEPPISDDDTNPTRTPASTAVLAQNVTPVLPARSPFDGPAIAEPPIAPDDTNPSLVTRQGLRPAAGSRRAGKGAQRAFALLMILGAAVLIAAAGFILLGGDDAEPDAAPLPPDVASDEGPDTDTNADDADDAVPDRAAPTNDSSEADNADAADDANRPDRSAPERDSAATFGPSPTPLALPTAAEDEIAAALSLPVADPVAERAIGRQSEPFTIRPGGTRTQVVQYTVQDGDTLESIAAKFDLDDYYTIIWSNKSSKYNPLRPGVQLNILPIDGVYHEVSEEQTIAQVAEEYGLDPYIIIDSPFNPALFGSAPETLLVRGMQVVIPGGESERALFLPAAPGSGTSSSGGPGGIIGTYTLWGCTADVQGGSMPFGRPLGNYTWMRGFTPGGHTGVDIAANPGDPVYASGAGTVVYAGWSDGGYGNVVVIAHGPVFSLYAHMTAASVSCGQQVSAGSVVGTVGSSGNSTGPHLHFEVRDADFNARNPQNYVGF